MRTSRLSRGTTEIFPRRFDFSLLATALLLSLIGVLFIGSAVPDQQVHIAWRQLVYLLVGLPVLFIVSRIDYRDLVEHAGLLFGLTLALLAAMPLLAPETAGTRAWIHLGPIRAQPSELARVVTILMLARIFENHDETSSDLSALFRFGLVVALPFGLVVAQNDLGMALTFLPLGAAALFLAGLSRRTWLTLLVLAAVAAVLVYAFALQGYQRKRLETFLDPGSDRLGAGYQVWQSKIAIGSGGLVGKGLRQGTQSGLGFLPARHTDFILAVVAEEAGFVGILVVFGLFALLLMRILAIAQRSRDRAGALLAAAVATLITFHLFINGGMVVGLVPTTGITLPFLSYGGSSLVSNLLAIGLVLSVGYRRFAND